MFGRETTGAFCPFIKKKCVKHECAMYTQVRGHNPNTGEDIDHWGCALAWMPVLTIENSQQQRQTAAAVESLRNNVAKGNEVLAAAAATAQERLLK